MKALLVTTPIRPTPSGYPPFACLSLLKHLRANGIEDVGFFDIDGLRPSHEEALAHIVATRPAVLGISAVVSTAYAYAKKLSIDVKAALPDCLIVLGGNLAASAEIILRKTGVDICVLGEGEKVFRKIVDRADQTKRVVDFADIPGLAFVGTDGAIVNTGYETPLEADTIYDIDWQDLEQASDIGIFVYPAFDGEELQADGFKHDRRSYQRQRLGKKMTTLVASKGCVARCTFCHRWDKGIRYIPVDTVMQRIAEVVEKYDVGFLAFGDENFGTDRKWLVEFCEKIRPYDVLWRVVGMRVNRISRDVVEMMKEAGCAFIGYGMESGSQRMLDTMEKKTTIEQNREAIKNTIELGIASPVQIVLGMPGENDETVAETIDFCVYGQTVAEWQNPNDLSINYAQALPGTPLYEFGRMRGLIGQQVDDEERYLLSISDRDAHDEFSTLNFTDVADLAVQVWRPRITVEVNHAYVRKFGIDHYRRVLLNDTNYFTAAKTDRGYYANPKRLVDRGVTTDTVHEVRDKYELADAERRLPSLFKLVAKGNLGLAMICYPVLFYRLRHLLLMFVLAKNVMRGGPRYAFRSLARYLRAKLSVMRLSNFPHSYQSLRKVMNSQGPLPSDSIEMLPLRRGR